MPHPPGEIEAKEEAGEPVAEQPQTDAPEQPEAPEQAPVHYYTINEGAARCAKEANSFYDYKPGSASLSVISFMRSALFLPVSTMGMTGWEAGGGWPRHAPPAEAERTAPGIPPG